MTEAIDEEASEDDDDIKTEYDDDDNETRGEDDQKKPSQNQQSNQKATQMKCSPIKSRDNSNSISPDKLSASSFRKLNTFACDTNNHQNTFRRSNLAVFQA